MEVPFYNTVPELVVQKWLKSNNIDFKANVPIKLKNGRFHQVDALLENARICIEVDGDFYHANPRKYLPDDVILKSHTRNRKEMKPLLAKEIWTRDLKITMQLQALNYRVIRIWESEVKGRNSDWKDRILSALPMPIPQ